MANPFSFTISDSNLKSGMVALYKDSGTATLSWMRGISTASQTVAWTD